MITRVNSGYGKKTTKGLEKLKKHYGGNKKIKLALIEDDKLLSQILREKLEMEGFNVIYAYDGRSGLEMVFEEHPDLILLDVIMPVMDGREMVQKLREDEWGKTVPVIFLTNLDRIDLLIKMDTRISSVKDYIVKEEWKLEDVVKQIKNKLNVE